MLIVGLLRLGDNGPQRAWAASGAALQRRPRDPTPILSSSTTPQR